jgi:hypothetical protein
MFGSAAVGLGVAAHTIGHLAIGLRVQIHVPIGHLAVGCDSAVDGVGVTAIGVSATNQAAYSARGTTSKPAAREIFLSTIKFWSTEMSCFYNLALKMRMDIASSSMPREKASA